MTMVMAFPTPVSWSDDHHYENESTRKRKREVCDQGHADHLLRNHGLLQAKLERPYYDNSELYSAWSGQSHLTDSKDDVLKVVEMAVLAKIESDYTKLATDELADALVAKAEDADFFKRSTATADAKRTRVAATVDENDEAWSFEACHFQINNWVVTGALCTRNPVTGVVRPLKINLMKVVREWHHTSGCHYKNAMFPAIGIKFANPNGVVNISSNGKIVSTGARTRINTIFILRTVAARLSVTLGQRIVVHNIRVRNIAGSARLPAQIDIVAMANENANECKDNELNFSGATLRIPRLAPITVLVFKSGNIVIAGGKDEAELEHGFREVAPLIRKYSTGVAAAVPGDGTTATIAATASDGSGRKRKTTPAPSKSKAEKRRE